MTDDAPDGLQNSSDGGTTGTHPETVPLELLVAPTTSNDSNLARLRLIPIAFWKIEDIRFAFYSSFHLMRIVS
jgi:hypothetical protein